MKKRCEVYSAKHLCYCVTASFCRLSFCHSTLLFVVVTIIIGIVSAIAIAFVVIIVLIAVINWRGLLG